MTVCPKCAGPAYSSPLKKVMSRACASCGVFIDVDGWKRIDPIEGPIVDEVNLRLERAKLLESSDG